jgi:glycosyltransferase involved in cell wall biosynthesis
LKLNILFISSWFPSSKHPTLGNFVVSHAKAVSQLHNVQVIHAVRLPNLNHKYSVEEKKEGNLSIFIIYFRAAKTGISFFDKIIDLSRHYSAYKKLYRKLNQKPDLVHANVIWPIGLFALYLKYRYKLKFVLTEHWTIYQKENRYQIKGLKKFLFKKIAKKSSTLMPVSLQLSKAMQESGMKGEFTIVPNAIDIDLFTFKEKKKKEDFHFLHISTLVDRAKNVSGILKSFRQLLNIDSNNFLTIVSDGELEEFINLAKHLAIPPKKIKFVGTQSQKQIVEHFHHTDAFILFSNYENLPVVILEAFATGTPVISTDVGGIKERFPENFGYLIKAKDENALLSSMKDIKQNYTNFEHEKISEYAKRYFSYNSVAEEYTNIYKKILNY